MSDEQQQPAAMSDAELEAIRRRAKKASRGPWLNQRGAIVAHDVALGEDREVAFVMPHHVAVSPVELNWLANADFIAGTSSDIPALLAEVDRLRSEVAVNERQWEGAAIAAEGIAMSVEALTARLRRLEEQNEAMREIVRAVANARWGIYPSGEHLFGMGDAMELTLKAAALVQQWEQAESEVGK